MSTMTADDHEESGDEDDGKPLPDDEDLDITKAEDDSRQRATTSNAVGLPSAAT
jgi:hypothetical protein